MASSDIEFAPSDNAATTLHPVITRGELRRGQAELRDALLNVPSLISIEHAHIEAWRTDCNVVGHTAHLVI